MTITRDMPPAVKEFVLEGDARDLVRALLRYTQNGTLSDTQASRVALAAGIALLPEQAFEAAAWLNTVDEPEDQLEREIVDNGPLRQLRRHALDRIAEEAQFSVDTLVDTLAAETAEVSTCAAVLAVVRVITGSNA